MTPNNADAMMDRALAAVAAEIAGMEREEQRAAAALAEFPVGTRVEVNPTGRLDDWHIGTVEGLYVWRSHGLKVVMDKPYDARGYGMQTHLVGMPGETGRGDLAAIRRPKR